MPCCAWHSYPNCAARQGTLTLQVNAKSTEHAHWPKLRSQSTRWRDCWEDHGVTRRRWDWSSHVFSLLLLLRSHSLLYADIEIIETPYLTSARVLFHWLFFSLPLSSQALQERYPEEFERTASHKLRSSDDMQFAFSYFYFLMSEKQEADMEEAYLQLDTDKSGLVREGGREGRREGGREKQRSHCYCCPSPSILSVRELRTLLAQVNSLPLELSAIQNFEGMLRDCDKDFNGTRPSVDPIEFETHYDPDLVS